MKMKIETRYILRKASEDDLHRINDIYNWAVLHSVATFDLEERQEEDALRWFNSHQDPYYPLYIVEVDGEITGWGSLSPFHSRPAYKQSGEFSIYVAPEWKGKRIGDALLQKLCAEAKLLGYHTLLGLITATNEPSICLSKKNGFVEVGRFREVGRKFGQLLDVIIMQKIF
jgi:L-amino acid N-acyltransferase